MPCDRGRVRRALRKACSQHLWMPVPQELEDLIVDAAAEQIRSLADFAGEHIACLEARHHLPWYLHGVAHAGIYRRELVQVSTLEDMDRILRQIKRDLK